MRRIALVILIAAATAAAQTTTTVKPAAKTEQQPTLKPLPKGQTRVFEAIVMKVSGIVQARPDREAKWKKLAVNDVLKPGVLVRTGRKSMVALRVGPNATILIDRQTRVAIPEIVQDGDTIRTRVGMEFGRIDVKASRIGLATDFAVSTPTSTLAVRGTVFRISWDAVNGARVQGVPDNRIRAIEMEYARDMAELSRSDRSDDEHPLPAVNAFWATYVVPLQGAITPEVLEDPRVQPTELSKVPQGEGLEAAHKAGGNKLDRLSGNGPSTGIPPVTDG